MHARVLLPNSTQILMHRQTMTAIRLRRGYSSLGMEEFDARSMGSSRPICKLELGGGGEGGDTIITKIIENDALQWLEGTFKNVIMGLAVDVPTSSFSGGVEGRDIGRRLLQ
jgi:hypothetical protein